ncbi:hypothetical protein RKE29_11615 [Streptomyces sp. B1866]|uniref:putative T7SS-secreted protein n=1 Tax=Streptomyces sp. B1866 TaxID=3075431 RepID=UPI0028911649|nr:hypothetical protein [Streptomyces sp. B1866]MDT3397286.1 hypothetical protein [Streptomyces sp. B1866]
MENVADDIAEKAGDAVDEATDWGADRLDDIGLDSAAAWVRAKGDAGSRRLGSESGELQLGHTEDPKELVHGDPGALRSTATRLTGLSKTYTRVGDGLRQLNSDELSGKTADSFRERVAQEPKKWYKVAHACEASAHALTNFAHTVEWAQGQAKDAIEAYKKGKTASEKARAEYNTKVDAYNKAADAYSKASSHEDGSGKPTHPGSFHDPGTADMEHARDLLAEARRQRDEARDEAQSRVSHACAGAPEKKSMTSLASLSSDGYKRFGEFKEDFLTPLKILSVLKGSQAIKALMLGGDAGEAFARIRDASMVGRRLNGIRPGSVRALDAFSKWLVPFSLAAGVKEMFDPTHHSARGTADRIMGGVEAGGAVAVLGGESMAVALGAASVAGAVPVVGWAALGVAGGYVLGNWAYDHREDIANASKAAWHATEHGAQSAWHATQDTARFAASELPKVGTAVNHVAGEAVHEAGDVAKSAAHAGKSVLKKVSFW